MRGSRRLVSPLTAAAAVVVAGASIAACLLLQHGVENQNRALLQSDTSQVVLILQTAVQNVGSQLSQLGTVTVASGNSQSVFDSQAKVIRTQPTASVALVETATTAPHVVLAAGPDLQTGQTLSDPIASAVRKALPTLSGSAVLHQGSKSFLLFTIVPPASPPGTVVIETSAVQPDKASPATSGPFKQLEIALYASATPRPDQLIVSTLGTRTLPAPTSTATLRVGALDWAVVGAAKAPLVGSFAEASPWIVLGIGLLLALALAGTTEVLVRRQRHTAQVVADREGELLEAQAALVRQERLSAVGEMATIIGHELRNPLGAAINSLFLVRHRLGENLDPDLDVHLSRAERETNRAASLSEDLTAYMRERPPTLVTLDLAEVTGEVLDSTPPPPGVTVTTPAPGITVTADKDQLLQVLINLVTNAYQAMADGGTLAIGGAETDSVTEITVTDEGPGIDPDVAERLFDPFVTTKVNGTGLGLAIVKQIVDAHDGSVAAEPGPSAGTRIVLRLPRRSS